jgi:hypothetical protein
MQSLLQLVRIVGRDSLPENIQLQQHILADGTAGAAVQPGSGSAFGALLHKLNKPLQDGTDAAEAAQKDGSSSDPAADKKKVEQYLQWRVQVLQRIQQPLAVAFR